MAQRVSEKGLVIVTGASGGIGYDLCKLFATDHHPLLLVARSGDKLKAFAEELTATCDVAVTTCALDLATPEAPEQLFETARNQGLPVEVLVNNAGFGDYGPFAEADLAAILPMLQLNVVALTHLTRLFLPGMLQRNAGGVLNVASIAGFLPGPLMAVYYASKAYVLHFSEALAEELRDTKVRVTTLCPGPTVTGFGERAGLRESRFFTGRVVMDARAVAEAGYQGFQKGRRIVVPGWRNQLLAQSYRFFPRALLAGLVRRVQTGAAPGARLPT